MPIDKDFSTIEKQLILYFNVDSSISIRGNVMTIHSVIVPKELRRQGKGTKAMQYLINYADENGYTIALTPSLDLGSRNLKKLRYFYRRLGFVRNTGRNADLSISQSFIRRPRNDYDLVISMEGGVIQHIAAINNYRIKVEYWDDDEADTTYFPDEIKSHECK